MAQLKDGRMIKEGQLVNFFTTMAMWKRDYKNRNPGVVLKVTWPAGFQEHRYSAQVLWSDGAITHEHSTYLQPVEGDDE